MGMGRVASLRVPLRATDSIMRSITNALYAHAVSLLAPCHCLVRFQPLGERARVLSKHVFAFSLIASHSESVNRGWITGACLLVFTAVTIVGCAHHPVVDDGSSVSYGWPRAGILLHPSRLPIQGRGYFSPPRWQARGLRYGTDELIGTIVWLGRELDRLHPGARVAIADLSRASGGPSRWHRSHQHGRDVDIPFMLKNQVGATVEAEVMRRFDDDGRVVVGRVERQGRVSKETLEVVDGSSKLVFDTGLNWTVVKLLLENPLSEIQYIFVSAGLKQLLLEYPTAQGEPAGLLARAALLLHQPSDSAAHDDHFHVRIYCSTSDRVYGCRDVGTLRWLKKDYKYARRHLHWGVIRLFEIIRRQNYGIPAVLNRF